MKFEDLQIGQYVYRPVFNINTVVTYKYISDETFSDNWDRKLKFSKQDIDSCFDSEEFAKCKLYLYKLELLQKEISDAQYTLNKHIGDKAKLEAAYGYLKDKYPEEFL